MRKELDINKITKEAIAQADQADGQENNSPGGQTLGAEAESSGDQKKESSLGAEAESSGEEMQDDELKSFEETIPKEFHKHPRWQEIYNKLKESKEKLKQLESSRKEISELSNEELLEEIQSRDLDNDSDEENQSRQSQQAQLAGADSPLYDSEKFSPEERNLYKFVKWAMQDSLKPIQEKITAHDMHLSRSQEEKQMQYLLSTEKQAEKMISDMGLDWGKEVKPQVESFIKERRKTNPDFGFGLNVMDITKMVIADKGIEIGKRLAVKDQEKLIQDKKKKQIEAGDENADTKTDYSKIRRLDQLVKAALHEANSKL